MICIPALKRQVPLNSISHFFRFLAQLFVLVVIVVGFSGCKRTKDTFTSRTYHQMTAKYNPLFNGEEAYKAGVLKVEQSWQEDFTKILPVYKWSNESNAGSLAPDMDRAIEKSIKVIQEHSMFIGNNQRNKYIDDSYLLMGKARFYKRDFYPAAETFNYILQQFDKSEMAYEARLWLALCKLEMENPEGARLDLELLYNNPSLPKNLKSHVLGAMAQMNIQLKDWPAVAVNLKEAVRQSKVKGDKVRFGFIHAQALVLAGKPEEASDVFAQVIKLQPSYDFYFQAQLNKARNFDVYLNDPRPVYKELDKMTRDDKNLDTRDQIYYVMAELALKEERTSQAERFLGQSVRSSTTNTTQKGLSYLKLGEMAFSFPDYVLAQAYYDSASTSLPETHPRAKEIAVRAETLGRLVRNLTIIKQQDSLLKVASLPEEERRIRAEQYVNKLKKEDERRKEKEEMEAFNKSLAESSEIGTGAPQAGNVTGGAWYFYNPTLLSKGRSDFNRIWGERPLADNWRQKSRIRGSGPQSENPLVSEENVNPNETEKSEGGRYDIETYLASIPLNEQAVENSHSAIREAFVDLGLVYKDGLEDIKKAIETYESLLKRYSVFSEKPRVLYSLFLMYRKAEQKLMAQQCKDTLIQKFANTEFAILAANDGVPQESVQSICVQKYELAYRAYDQGELQNAVSLCQSCLLDCNEDQLLPSVKLLTALCYGRMGRSKEMRLALEDVSKTHTGSLAASKADAILSLLNPTLPKKEESQELQDEKNLPSEESKETESKIQYVLNVNSPHRYVLMLKGGGFGANEFQVALVDHNSKYSRMDNLKVQMMPLGNEFMAIVVSGFKNAGEAGKYLNQLKKNSEFEILKSAEEFDEFVISQENYAPFFKGKDLDGYLAFYNANYK